MSDLTGKLPKNTYKDLLQVSNSNSGIDTTKRAVEDGEGTASPLELSTTVVNISSGFELGGVAVSGVAIGTDVIKNVRIHGAVGDGVADDQPAVQAAIDAAGTGGVVYIPPGTYLLTAAGLTISNDDVTMILDRGATLKMNNDTTLLVISGTGVSVRGGTWDGNGAQTGDKTIISVGERSLIENTDILIGSGQSHGIRASGKSDWIIRNNRIVSSTLSCIFVTGSAGPNHARNGLIQGNNLTKTGAAALSAITVHSTISSTDVSGTQIVDNKISIGGADTFGIEVGNFSGDTPVDIIVADNQITSTADSQASISLAGVTNSSVTGNVLNSNGFDWTTAGIEFAAVSRSIADGNVIRSAATGGVGISLQGGTAAVDDNVISNNIIDGFSNENTDRAGIRLDTTTGVSVSRNIVKGNIILFPTATNAGVTYMGIFLRSNHASGVVEHNMILDNLIFGNGDTAVIGIFPSEDAGTQGNTIIRGNHMMDLNWGIRRNSTSGDNVVLDNTFDTVTTEYSGTPATTEILRKVNQPKAQNFAANDLTPDISGGVLFKTLNDTSTRIITALAGGVDGDVVRIIINDAFTEIDFTGTTLKGNAGVNWSPSSGDHMTCVHDGTDWFCNISDNTA